MVRMHAAFHSALVMCVAFSQKPMQAASDLPPPPGALGAVSLALVEELPGESARLLCSDPPVENWSGSCGDSGATGAISGMGAASPEGGGSAAVPDSGVEVSMVTEAAAASAAADAAVVVGSAGTGDAKAAGAGNAGVLPTDGRATVATGAGLAGTSSFGAMRCG
jgi:hypothetical protein